MADFALLWTIMSHRVVSKRLTLVVNSADKTGDHMSRILGVASALLVVGGSWSVSAQQPITVAPSAPKPINARSLPGPRSNILSIIQGTALNSNNAPMPDTLVRLRDARFG